VHFVEAGAAQSGLADDSFDLVLARFLLQHVPSVDDVLAEFRRLLTGGGRVIVVDADFAFSTLIEPEPEFAPHLLAAVM
jgi:ubiquinone/menaquinone biosynthesis C-methylase UbiE